MEAKPAETLKKKKINKAKLKKTIKNVLCRSDPIFWPSISDVENETLQVVLKQQEVPIPEFKKPHWNELKGIPKEKRPKPPKIEKVKGLLFGISECRSMIENGQCSAILIEAEVNPRSIVQPVLEACMSSRIPAVCMTGLRKITTSYFGIPTSCLGVQKDYLTDISEKVSEIGSNKLPLTQKDDKMKVKPIETSVCQGKEDCSMDIEELTQFQYLYRTNKKTRVFVPPTEHKTTKDVNKFNGQDFIEFSEKPIEQRKNHFKKMIVKRITNNASRVKVK